jgi:hypothetical protein
MDRADSNDALDRGIDRRQGRRRARRGAEDVAGVVSPEFLAHLSRAGLSEDAQRDVAETVRLLAPMDMWGFRRHMEREDRRTEREDRRPAVREDRRRVTGISELNARLGLNADGSTPAADSSGTPDSGRSL